MSEHAFTFKGWNVRHSGKMNDEVLGWLSALFVLLRDDDEASVAALKAACHALLHNMESVPASPSGPER